MVVSLIGPLEHPLTQRILLIAAYAGVQLKVVNISYDEYQQLISCDGSDNKVKKFQLNCHPMCRLPVLKTDEGYMFDCNSIIRYIARTEVQLNALKEGDEKNGEASKFPHPDYTVPYAMYGHSLSENALVDSWLDFISKNFDVFLFRKESKVPNEKVMRTALEGIEMRIKVTKENMIQANSVSALHTSRTPRASMNTNTADIEQFLEEMNNNYFQRNRKVSAAYNISGNIKNKQNEKERNEKNEQMDSIRRTTQLLDGGNGGDALFSARASTFLSPRMSTAETPRNRNKNASKFVFLVNDSLTAADLVIASVLHLIFNNKNNKYVEAGDLGAFKDAPKTYPETFAYYKTIFSLPVAAEITKILKA